MKYAERNKRIKEEAEDEDSVFKDKLNEETDFWEEFENEKNFIIPDKVTKIVSTNVGHNL